MLHWIFRKQIQKKASVMGKEKEASKKLKGYKQFTLDNMPNAAIKETIKTNQPIQQKQIIITEIVAIAREDDLALKVSFKLLPSKTAFSKLKSDMWFDNQQISSSLIRIIQGPLGKYEFELTPVLGMKGIAAGFYTIRIEMYEPWLDEEKLSFTSKEVTVEYVPKTRESMLIKIPIVKSFEGVDLVVVSESDRNIYREIEETFKNESVSKRDEW